MIQANMHEAKTQLSRLIERAEAGEEVVIARHGRPVVRLTPLAPAGNGRDIVGCMSAEVALPSQADLSQLAASLREDLLADAKFDVELGDELEYIPGAR